MGELRWRAPQAPLPLDGTREALAFGAALPAAREPPRRRRLRRAGHAGRQRGLPLPRRLRARLPARRRCRAARRGCPSWSGSTAAATRSEPRSNYDGSRLAATHGLVVVTINYRLGAARLVPARGAARGARPRRGLGQLRHPRPASARSRGCRTTSPPSAATRATSRSSASPRAARTCSRCSSRRSPAACSTARSSRAAAPGATPRPRPSTPSTPRSPALGRAPRRSCSVCSSARGARATASPPAGRSRRCGRSRSPRSCAACPSRACSRRTPPTAPAATTRRACSATARCCRTSRSRSSLRAPAGPTRCP